MKTCAGYALNQRKAKPLPAIDPQMITSYPAPGINRNSR
jgi:hypothetical protein